MPITMRVIRLKFTPLEFETPLLDLLLGVNLTLKFTPLEFETFFLKSFVKLVIVKIYSVGV